jgi:two-component system, LytTR family, response regulator
MNKIKVILTDDEPDGIATLKKMLETNCPQVQIVATCANAAAAMQQIELQKPDVIFLDIQMPGKSGIELLADLPERKFETIFVTAHNEYVLQALQLSAADYLLKPVDEDRLVEAVQRVAEKLGQKNETANLEVLLHNLQTANEFLKMKLCVPTLKGFIVLKLEQIIVCEAEKNYTIFHLQDKKQITASRSLLDYEKVLISTWFFRVHKTYLINLHHVTEYHRGEGGIVLMSNGMEVDVSRRKKDEFLSRVKQLFKH